MINSCNARSSTVAGRAPVPPYPVGTRSPRRFSRTCPHTRCSLQNRPPLGMASRLSPPTVPSPSRPTPECSAARRITRAESCATQPMPTWALLPSPSAPTGSGPAIPTIGVRMRGHRRRRWTDSADCVPIHRNNSGGELRLSSEFFDAATGFIDSSVRRPPGGDEFAFLGLNADRRRAVRSVFSSAVEFRARVQSPSSRAR